MLNAEHGREARSRDERHRMEQVVPLKAVRDPGSDVEQPVSGALTTVARQVLDRSPVPCMITIGTEHRVAYANPSFLAHPALGKGLAVHQPFADTIGVASRAGRNDVRGAVALIAETLDAVYRTRDALPDVELADVASADDTPAVPTSIVAWPVINTMGAIGGVAVQLRDRTTERHERHEREALAEQMRLINQGLQRTALREEELTQRAEAASEAKSAFLATMSHELRTPLTAILGYEELLADGITGPVTEEQRTQLRRIKVSAIHLLALIDQMLTLSRVEAGREVLECEMVDAADIVDQATALVTPLAMSRGIPLRTELPAHRVRFSADSMKLRQILVNLLANAVRFTHQGEIVLGVEGPRPGAGGDGAPDEVVFSVRDTGIGIAPTHLEAIFDAFWQVEQTATRKVGGTGLGLNLSRRLAQLMGGDITVTSVLHEGSVFRVHIPVERPRGE